MAPAALRNSKSVSQSGWLAALSRASQLGMPDHGRAQDVRLRAGLGGARAGGMMVYACRCNTQTKPTVQS